VEPVTIIKKLLVLLLYFFLSLFKKKDLNSLLVLTYHRISEKPDFEDSLKVSRATFERQIVFLKDHYHFLSGDQLTDILTYKKNYPEKSCLVTFDDGWADNYTNAFPILCKYNVPAMIFLSTDFIGTNNAFWHEKLSNILKSKVVNNEMEQQIVKYLPPEISGPIEQIMRLPYNSRQQLINDVIENMKRLGPRDIEHILYDLENIVHMDRGEKKPSMLSWSQVKEMSQKDICFGSHTKSHAILTQHADADIAEEIQGAKTNIEKNLAKRVDFLAYPNGNYNDTVVQETKKAGYLAAFTCIHGVNHYHDDQYILKRINVKEYTSSGLTRRFSKLYFNIELSEVRTFMIKGKELVRNIIGLRKM
jgi:peptidoglycan/xylan/chitin deacetylase (PgdA/CDA1 family)